MTATFRATLRVTGEGRLAEFGECVRQLMVRDIDAERYSEHHADGVLEYRFEIRKGIPFPEFAGASREFPELRVEAHWEDPARGVRGRALIENGRLVEQSSTPLDAGPLALDVSVAADGRLVLALACREMDGALLGYAANAGRHAYFRYAEGALRIAPDAGERWEDGTPLAPGALAELEDIAFAFAAQWLWYDEALPGENAFERARYADYGYAVRGANLRAERLVELRRAAPSAEGTLRYSTLDAAGLRVREALARAWGAEGG